MITTTAAGSIKKRRCNQNRAGRPFRGERYLHRGIRQVPPKALSSAEWPKGDWRPCLGGAQPPEDILQVLRTSCFFQMNLVINISSPGRLIRRDKRFCFISVVLTRVYEGYVRVYAPGLNVKSLRYANIIALNMCECDSVCVFGHMGGRCTHSQLN